MSDNAVSYEGFLRQNPLFARFSEVEITRLAKVLHPRRFPVGAMLCQEGQPGEQAYLIIQGQVIVVKNLDNGERVLSERLPGDFIGEMSLFDPNGWRTASMRAQTDVEVLELNHADLERLLQQHPTLAYEILRQLSLRLRDTDDAIICDLQAKNDELARAYAELQLAQAQIIEKEKLEHELQLAYRIQRSILPTLPQIAGLDLGFNLDPARAVGGDFFDIIPLDSQRVAMTIGDVSDKGVPAAIFMALCRSLLRAEARPQATPSQVLAQVNQHLLGMNEMGMFVTVLYGVLDVVSRQFHFARAGHEVPMLIMNGGRARYCPQGRGQLLGILPQPVIDEQTVSLAGEDMLLLYTDGVPDALDAHGQRLGYEALATLAVANCCRSAQDTCDAILRSLLQRQGDSLQFDDMMVVAARFSDSSTSGRD
jgi:serine phosphatase RsbU (regulator of sigma subunit)